jgi:hypothetical protein
MVHVHSFMTTCMLLHVVKQLVFSFFLHLPTPLSGPPARCLLASSLVLGPSSHPTLILLSLYPLISKLLASPPKPMALNTQEI